MYYTYLYLFCILLCIIFEWHGWKIHWKSSCIIVLLYYFVFCIILYFVLSNPATNQTISVLAIGLWVDTLMVCSPPRQPDPPSPFAHPFLPWPRPPPDPPVNVCICAGHVRRVVCRRAPRERDVVPTQHHRWAVFVCVRVRVQPLNPARMPGPAPWSRRNDPCPRGDAQSLVPRGPLL